MTKPQTLLPASGELVIYQSEDGRIRLETRLENETLWLTQQRMADLFQTTKQNIGQHIRNVLVKNELVSESVIKGFFTTAVAEDEGIYPTMDQAHRAASIGYRIYHRGS